MLSIVMAARICRARFGWTGRSTAPRRRRIARGTCRAVAVRFDARCNPAASSLNDRFSGPPISNVAPRVDGSTTARSTRAATSETDTKLIGLAPRPNMTGRPEVPAVWSSRSSQNSAKAVARTIVHGTPLPRRYSSARCFIRKSSIGCVADAPTMDISTTAAFAATAASMRRRLPSRSTEAGDTLTDVAKPVNRRHDGAHAHHRRTEGATVSHVADDDVDLAVIEMSGALPVAREHANGKTSRL